MSQADVVGRGVLEIGADASQVDSDLGRTMPSAGKNAGNLLSNAFSVALGIGMAKAVSAVGSTVRAAFSTVFKGGFDRLSSIDTAEQKLLGLGHSTESVASIMDSALQSVKGTAYGLGDAAKISATMVASGIKPGEDLTRTLKLLADTTTIAGTSMGDIGSVFTKITTTGKLTGESLAQLQERGVPVLKFLADQYGVTAAEASQMVRDGKVDFETFQTAMEAGLGGAALSSGNTFVGAMANVRAALGRLGATLLGPAFEQMAPFFTGTLIPAIDALAPAFTKAGEVVGVWVAKTLSGITTLFEWLSGLKQRWDDFRSSMGGSISLSWLTPLLTGLGTLAVTFGGLTKISGLVAAAGGLAGAFSKLVGPLLKVLGPFQRLWPLIAGHPLLMLAGVVAGLVAAFVSAGGTGESFTAMIAGMGEKVTSFAEALPGMVTQLLGMVAQVLPGIMEALTSALGAIAEVIPQILPPILEAIIMLVQAIASLLPTLLPVLLEAATTLFLGLVQVVGVVLPVLIEAVLGLLMAVVGIIPTVIPVLIEGAVTLFMALVEALPLVLPPLIEAVTGTIDAVAEFLPGLISALLEAAVTLFTALVDALPEILPPLIAGALDVITAVVDLLPTLIPVLLDAGIALFTAIVEAVPEILPQLLQAALEVITAVIELLPTLIGTLLEAAVQLFMAIVQAVIDVTPKVLGMITGTLIPEMLGAVAGAVAPMLDKGREVLEGFWNGVKDKWDAVSEWFGGIPSKVTSAVGNVGSILKSAGRSIIEGFWNGLKEKWEDVKDWVGGIGDWIADHKGPKAYDLALLEPAGSWIMQGLQAGIRAEIPNLARTLRDVTGTIQGVNNGVSSLASKLFWYEVGQPIGQGTQLGVKDEERDLIKATRNLMLNSIPEVPRLPVNTVSAESRANAPVQENHYHFAADAISVPISELAELRTLEEFLEMLRVAERKR